MLDAMAVGAIVQSAHSVCDVETEGLTGKREELQPMAATTLSVHKGFCAPQYLHLVLPVPPHRIVR